MDYSQFLVMSQELGLIAVFLLVFLFDTFAPRKALSATAPVVCVLFALFTVVNLLLPCCCCGSCTVEPQSAFGGMYVTNQALFTIKNILNVGVLVVLIQSIKWVNGPDQIMRRGEFYELLLVTLFGMYLMMSSRHFLTFIIGLESASLPLAAMVAFEKKKYESHEAAIKYLLTALFSSAIMLMGVSFVYALSGSLYFADIAASSLETCPLLVVALVFVLAGVGFKLSLVPFHLWTADVYQGAPTSVTSYLSVISKGATAIAAFIIFALAFGEFYSEVWHWMLYAIIILTITIGNLFAIRQKNMKRFLAFSSISQAGYIMLGLIACSPAGLTAMMYYILVYIFSNLAAFGVIQAIENNTGKLSMDDYNGLYKTNPMLSVTMMLAMFSLAGIPPFAGFFSKFFIFRAAVEPGTTALYVLVLIALINTIVSLYYYLLVVKAMFIKPDEPVIARFCSAVSERIGMWICVAGIVILGLASCFYSDIAAAVESGFNSLL